MVVHDGADFAYADPPRLIAAGELPPLVAALVQTRDRMGEHAGGRRHSHYLFARELLPQLGARYRIASEPRLRVLLGASLGAVASLATAFRHPGCSAAWC